MIENYESHITCIKSIQIPSRMCHDYEDDANDDEANDDEANVWSNVPKTFSIIMSSVYYKN